MEQFIDGSAVSKYFGVSKETISDWRKTLGLPSHRFAKGRRGGTVLYRLSEIEAWSRKFGPKSRVV